MKLYRFYKLVDPRDKSIRYVGQTTSTLEQRLRQHITDKEDTAKVTWIQGLIEAGYKPLVNLLEERQMEHGDACLLEAQWIYHHLLQGHPLTNTINDSPLIFNLLACSEVDIFDDRILLTLFQIGQSLEMYHSIYNMPCGLPDGLITEAERIVEYISKVTKLGIFPHIVNINIKAALYSQWEYESKKKKRHAELYYQYRYKDINHG